MPVDLDFLPPPRWRKATLVLLVFGVLASVASLWQRHHWLERLESLRMQRASQDEFSATTQRTPGGPRSARQLKELRDVVASLQQPWEPMLEALQETLRPEVQLTGLQQDTLATRWHVAGAADSSAAFADLQQRLREHGGWTTVQPVSETRQTAPGTKPVSFMMLLEWRQP